MDVDNLPTGPYRIPEASTNPIGALVMNYKLFKGIEFDDRLWDLKHWARGMRTAREVILICKTYEMAKKCLEEIGGRYDSQDIPWNFETISKNAHEWYAKKERRHDQQKRERFRNALNEQRSNYEAERKGKIISAREVIGSLRNFQVIRDSNGAEGGNGNSENGTVGKRVPPTGMETPEDRRSGEDKGAVGL